MDGVDIQVLSKVEQWTREGHAVVLGTIARTWGSAPRPVGALVAIRDDGQIAGSVSGGCIEDDLVARVGEFFGAHSAPQTVRYGVSAEEATRFGLPCGGTLEIVLEQVAAHTRIADLLAHICAGRRVRRTLDLANGAVTLAQVSEAEALHCTAERLVSYFGPRYRLLLIGAGQLSAYLAEFARMLDYAVTVCDPRSEYAETWEIAGVTLTREMPDDAVIAFRPDAHSAIIALTHDPKLDDMALLEALVSEAFYVGAIGSHKNQEKRRVRLAEHFDLSREVLDRLHGPVGIKNGARTPAEIAVAILADLTAARYGYRIPEPLPLRPLAAAADPAVV
ncbi:MAG: XdhC family protein [Betaproteobacteria bacterium]|nr:XdhC family protein [Betaproteobacteria bacterium]